ncbi:MAG: hypothetical protein KDA52_02055 [Planctomycetaceae bacterium]|nr:hypothetical protein [Planctomycetaceae bacterium]
MSRLLIGNFDFEHSLAAAGQPLPGGLRRIVAELACSWGVAAQTGDALWSPDPANRAFLERIEQSGLPAMRIASSVEDVPPGMALVPWGWTAEVVAFGGSLGAHIDSPPLDVVRRLNSRRFSHQQEQRLGVGLPGSAIVESLNELTGAINAMPVSFDGWVVKAEFSNSSRERFVHRGRQPFDVDALTRWAKSRLTRGHAVFVEPWVDRVEEVGVQLTVPQNGQPYVEGVTRLLVDNVGRFLGCEFTPAIDHDPAWTDAVTVGLKVAAIAQQDGYFGPMGIDAMRYRLPNGEDRLRPLQDVNARWTMGRLSLGLRRLLSNEGESFPSWDRGTFHVKPAIAVELGNADQTHRI